MCVPELTLRLLKHLGVFSKFETSRVSSNASVLIRLELRDVFLFVFFVCQREHYIFLVVDDQPT